MSEISEVDQFCGNIVISIEKMLEQLPSVNADCSIYQVSKQLREMNNSAYTPQLISIGPFHHRSRNDLIATEQYKLQGLTNFLHRLDNKMISLEFLVKTTQTLMKEVRNCYAEPVKMSDEDFVKMMLVDGCFIVEFLILYYEQYDPSAFSKIQNNVDLSFYKRIPHIYIDLIKLENQIPFFLLQHLFDLVPQNYAPSSFIRLTYVFLQCGLIYNYSLSDASSIKPKHFVDFLSFFFVLPTMPPRHNINDKNFIIPPSITELCEAGVTIKKAKNAKHIMDITFKNGVFEIPTLYIDDYFETMMRNLIAFENLSMENYRCIQYVSLLDSLICTEKDVSLLVKAEIIINDIGGNDKEVSELFNNLGKFVIVSNCYHFNDISNALHRHCNRRWNKAKASLKHNYFNTPWAIVSFFAATLLIVLTLLQTIFSGVSTFSNDI